MSNFKEFDIYQIGTEIQLTGVIYQDKDKAYLLFLPAEDLNHVDLNVATIMKMTLEEWQDFFRQSDLVERECTDDQNKKIILRKTQRQVDAHVSWAVYRRDNYTCRYCGKNDVPLTVDHIICWEDGGPWTMDNILTSCKRCNRARGNMPYEEWIDSWEYSQVRDGVDLDTQRKNIEIVLTLNNIKRVKRRSR